jgi:hypothetical protein
MSCRLLFFKSQHLLFSEYFPLAFNYFDKVRIDIFNIAFLEYYRVKVCIRAE